MAVETIAQSPSTVRCTHCTQPVPKGLLAAGEEHQFCCHGCKAAYSIIHACGLDRYYAVRDADPARLAEPGRTTGRLYAEFDDPTFRSLYVKGDPAGVCFVELFLSGVHCAACTWLLERLPRVLPGVLDATLDFRRAMIRVTWRNDQVSLSQIGRALDSLGYPPHPARDARSRELRRADDRRALVRIAVAGACAGNAMLFALALYAGLFSAMEASHREFFRWMSMVVTLVALAWPGAVFFRGAIAAVRTRAVHLDIPIALALFAGGVWSAFSTIRGHGEIYFDSLSVLVFLLLVGRFIQQRQQRWAGDAVELLFSLTPTSARRIESGEVRDVPIEAVRPEDLLEVRAGDSIPADGVVEEGESSVDQALLTGESRPVRVGAGDPVHAGSVNVGASLRVRVSATGERTRVGRLMKLVEEAAQRRAPIVRLADRASGWFVVGMLGLAAATFTIWLFRDAPHAVDHAVALLVVTCPCALGLATPLTLTVALGRAAREGILIKGGDSIQRLDRPGMLYLDKTGTITYGRMSLEKWEGDEKVRPLIAALEAHSSHPIARALARDLADGSEHDVRDVHQTTGGGIQGVVNNLEILAGSPAFLRSRSVKDPARLFAREPALAAQGLTPVAFAVEGVLVAIGGLGDAVRPDAARAIGLLQRAGWTVGILSGDNPELVWSVAERVGIPSQLAIGGLSPEAKLDAVRKAGASGNVVMVGDGVNDTAALAAAGVGIAVHGGAEASLATADIYLSRPGLSGIVDLVRGSGRTMRVIRRGLGVSLFYNIAAGTLAVLGLMNPIAAAVVMPVSSLSVLVLSFRSRTFGGRS
jgi:Cu2+-exporting ATPase